MRQTSGNGVTELERWNPFEEFDRLHRQLLSWLDTWSPLSWPDVTTTAFTPVADVEETDDAYLVELEVPGIKRDDLDIEVSGRRLSVRGERKEKERVGVLRRRERAVGRFSYELTLPSGIEEDEVEARLDDGVLSIRLPKPERERPRRIEIR
ncbi:MAG: Hsp20/alpha crystallin family protein [Thermoanaerobacterales bacterium]